MRIDRLLAIIILLLNREKIKACDLAGRFEVSIRTIYRDIDAINLAGIPIISYPGNNGGFGIMENYKLERQVLSMNDMLSILNTLKSVHSTLTDSSLDTAIDKFTSLVPQEGLSKLHEYSEQFVIDIMPLGFHKRQRQFLKVIHSAIQERKLLSFVYRSMKGECLTRTAEPMTLLFKGYAWYLFAFCRTRQDYRIFRLSRMNDVVMLAQTFTRRNQSYKNYADFDVDRSELVHLTLKFRARARVKVEDFFFEDNISLQPDGSILVSVSWPYDEWVIAHLLSYGEDLEVVAPSYIRNLLLKKAKKIQKIYET
ncbi:MAG: YafY family transcriptional regulator [Spirochaetales bacterium]|nr:YafY family transcriptional regulator [Spirochaetales bacterium]